MANTVESIKAQVNVLKAKAKLHELTDLYEKIKLQEDAYKDNATNAVMPSLGFVKLLIEDRIVELTREMLEANRDAEKSENK